MYQRRYHFNGSKALRVLSLAFRPILPYPGIEGSLIDLAYFTIFLRREATCFIFFQYSQYLFLCADCPLSDDASIPILFHSFQYVKEQSYFLIAFIRMGSFPSV